ncbi:hypothetical protein [Methanosarcina barkeri]|uniref:Uncharacterized protein n=1 Tax=Methanosarcina barkeri (strain Fusaro / DSM 804) TaxID=269797 RepID=Q469J0_METBF|nr:hypothetical protein [Methanosarcina barkeri]
MGFYDRGNSYRSGNRNIHYRCFRGGNSGPSETHKVICFDYLTTGLRPEFYSNGPKERLFIAIENFLITGNPKYDLNCVSM